ncbi:hypothetical protein FM042_05260 [Aliidiomarina halalkaliphila]|uniref:Uncharacterized protein n=1 Tax=Aliidiomarina halalkaliphila TaxID=2593535 RepID=A0A552X5G7_9GAMM|nr:hypothetical protein [Aliidiomarina halalkaliphila]TRW50245.1 hypothetical protein FM042_05260 [Aliidiomarina halalkaliphila]
MLAFTKKIIIALFILALFGAPAQAEEFHPVVAEYVSHEMIPCEHSDELIYCINDIYHYRYRIVESHSPMLAAGDVISALFTSSHHYPAFMEERFTYFLLMRHNDQWVIDDFLWSFIYRTSDNQFAECGCSLLEGRVDDPPQDLCQLATFQPRIQIDITHASAYGRAKYEENPAWAVNGNTALCTRGIYTKDLPKLFL